VFGEASKRGHALHQKIYGKNIAFDDSRTLNAAPDYYYIVKREFTLRVGRFPCATRSSPYYLRDSYHNSYCVDLFYGYIFSFDAILDDLETEHCIISALLGIDCQEQVRNHMIGMQINGTKKEQILAFRNVALKLADKLNVKFKTEPIPIPSVPKGVTL
jgi:hypothetical protein